MKTLTLTLAIAALPLFSSAATWTLDSCINHALEHNINVRQARLQEHSGELDITAARDRYLPTLNGGLSQQFSFGRGLTAENTYADRNTQSLGWNVNFNLPLFQGLSAYRNEQLAKANLLALVEETAAVADDVTLNVMAAYLQALYTGELVEVAAETQRLSEVELERRRSLLEAGKIAEVEVIQAEAQLASDEVSLTTARNNHTLALVDLAQLLQLGDAIDDFDVAPLTDDSLLPLDAETVYANALQSNHSLLASQRRIEAADRQVSLAKTGYLPQLSFFTGLGSSYYKLNGAQNDGFGTQMRHNFATNIGFSLSVPIFDAFSTRNNVRRAHLARQTAELNYDQARENLFKAIQQAYYQAVGAEKKMASTATALEATKAAFEAMQEKYNYGRANATEFEQAKSAYIRAKSEHVQARYEASLRNRILQYYNRSFVGAFVGA